MSFAFSAVCACCMWARISRLFGPAVCAAVLTRKKRQSSETILPATPTAFCVRTNTAPRFFLILTKTLIEGCIPQFYVLQPSALPQANKETLGLEFPGPALRLPG